VAQALRDGKRKGSTIHPHEIACALPTSATSDLHYPNTLARVVDECKEAPASSSQRVNGAFPLTADPTPSILVL